jgi:hypothetical protein
MAVKRKTVLIVVGLIAALGVLVAWGLIYPGFQPELASSEPKSAAPLPPQSPPPAGPDAQAPPSTSVDSPALPPADPVGPTHADGRQGKSSRPWFAPDASPDLRGPPSAEPEQSAQAPMFPWPPPEASASYVLPAAVFAKANTLGDVADEILAALTSQGYVEHSYFATPHGVALVTRLERINTDGTRAAPRWLSGFNPPGLIDFLRGLFFVEPGNYRVIVFIIENDAFQQSGAQVSEDDAKAWLRTGLNVLPQQLAQEKFYGNCTALIYEFMSTGDRVKLVDSELSGLDHLKLAGLQSLLGTAH